MKRSTVKQKSGDLLSRPPATGVLQRKCACGNQAVGGGQCSECAKKNETLQRKAKSADEVNRVPASVQEVLNSPGHPLDSDTRSFMEPQFGRDFSQVRLHTDATAAKSAEAVNALAYTVGRDVVFGAGEYQPGSNRGRELLAHELTHVDQQSGMPVGALQTMGGTGALEAEADQNASFISGGTGRSANTHAGSPNGLGIQRKEKPGEMAPTMKFQIIVDFSSMTADHARDCFAAYQQMSAKDRRKAFDANYPKGITNLLKALPAEDASKTYRNEVREMLRWIEEAETRKASGLTDDEMAKAMGTDMRTKAVATATATKIKKGSTKAPTEAEISKAHDENVKKTSVPEATTNRWTALSPKQKKETLAAGKKAIEDLVAHAAKTHPELKLTKDSFKLDFFGVDDRGQGVLAFSDTVGGKPVAAVGFDFVTAVQVKPAYALSTVVHEVFGHPEYGVYGTEYHLELYDKAKKKAGFGKKVEGSKQRLAEKDAFAYQETEIYSLMRELPYWTEVTPEDEKKSPGLTELNFNPAKGVSDRIGLLKTQWKDAKLAIPLLRGLFVRLRSDPRMTKKAIDAFIAGLNAHFSKDEVKEITK